MVLLGVARGTGGLVLLSRGAADASIQVGSAVVSRVGTALVLLGLALVVAAVGVLRRREVSPVGPPGS
jgi:hypothetical protein